MQLLGALKELDARLSAASTSDGRETLEYFMSDAISELVNKRVHLQQQRKPSEELRKMGPGTFRTHYGMISKLEEDITRQEEKISEYAAQIRRLVTVEPWSAEDIIYKKTESNRQADANIQNVAEVEKRQAQIHRNRTEMLYKFKHEFPNKRDKRRVFWGMNGDDRMDILIRLYPDLTSGNESIAGSAQIKVNDFFKDQLDP